MKLLDVFGKCNGINRLTFEDFKSLGWTYNDYFSYMSLCDEIRAATMMTEHVKKIEGFPTKNKHKRAESLVEQRTQALFDWLGQFNDGEMPNPVGAYLWMSAGIRYSILDFLSPSRNRTEPNPGLLYCSSYDFTLWIETYVSNLLRGKPLIEFDAVFEKRIEDMDESELAEKIDSLRFEISTIREPEFPKSPDHYVALMRWAKLQARYEDLSDLEDELDECEERLKLITEKKPTFDSARNILYVYKYGNIICKKEKHDLVDVNCIIRCAGNQIILNAQYCKDCDKFIISEKSYKDYVADHKLIPIKLQYVDADGSFPQILYRTERSEYSPLSLAGYTVRERDGLTEEERHDLLIAMIENGVMDKYEIIMYLEMFINTNGVKYNMFRAVSKWQNDVEFIRAYNMENQDEYNIDRIERY